MFTILSFTKRNNDFPKCFPFLPVDNKPAAAAGLSKGSISQMCFESSFSNQLLAAVTPPSCPQESHAVSSTQVQTGCFQQMPCTVTQHPWLGAAGSWQHTACPAVGFPQTCSTVLACARDITAK